MKNMTFYKIFQLQEANLTIHMVSNGCYLLNLTGTNGNCVHHLPLLPNHPSVMRCIWCAASFTSSVVTSTDCGFCAVSSTSIF